MGSTIAERRIELVKLLGGTPAEAFRFDATQLRFFHGVSLADLRVPFHVAPEVTHLVASAARQLALMLVSRHRELMSEDDFERRFLLDAEFGALPPAPSNLAPTSGGPDVRACSEIAPRAHPLLTGGVMATWLGPGGGGRSLVALVIEVLRRALAESGETRTREPTALLAALMLSTALGSVDRAIRSLALPQLIARPVAGAAGAGIFLALRLGMDRVLRERPLSQDAVARIESTINPLALLGGRALAIGSGITLYGCELLAGIPDADALLARHGELFNADVIQQAVERALKDDRAAFDRAEAAVGLAALRNRLVRCAALGEEQLFPASLTALLTELALRPERLSAVFDDDKQRKVFWKDLLDQAALLAERPRRDLEGLAKFAKAYSPKSPAAGTGLNDAQVRAEYARCATAFLCDVWLERTVERARRVLDPRTGSEAEGGLEAQYEAGHLYLITARAQPILKSTTVPSVGHLFVDVKDFTRRTGLLGQAAMAEFLRREFYVPILASAKAQYGGLSHLADRGGLSLNNLLGDAVSMSGTVESLLAVAGDLRRHLVSYERRLARAISSEQVAQSVRSIEEEFERRLRASKPEQVPRITLEREVALARAKGEGLEAGVFISYGPAPVVVALEDDVFGKSKVAIADRINESARGTARSAGARARADAWLAHERTRTQRPLEQPWSVFVGAPLQVSVPSSAEAVLRQALREGGVDAAVSAMAPLLREAIEDWQKGSDVSGDIYNAGVALSDEAFTAYQEAMAGRRAFREVLLDSQSLHPSITARYAIEPGPLRLVFSIDASSRPADVFRYVGRVAFKGFERKGGIGVWELTAEHGIGGMLAQLHAPSPRGRSLP